MAVSGLIFIGGAVLLLALWLTFAADLMYLGPRGVRWIYDRFARFWNLDVGEHRLRSRSNGSLVPHLQAAVADAPKGRYLDVATGTARVPLLIASTPGFDGHIDGVDLSRNMLAKGRAIARSKGVEHQISLQEADAAQLPFPDGWFDVVTCIDAPLPDRKKALAEMARVMAPGATLLTDRRTGRLRLLLPGKVMSRARYEKVLAAQGFEGVRWHPWMAGEELVIAHRRERGAREAQKSLSVGSDSVTA